MPNRPTYPPDQQQPTSRPVSPSPPIPHQNPWGFLVTKKTTPCELITKRELFAAMAMQGLLASGFTQETFGDLQADAVRHADALIAELSKPTE